MKKKLLTLLGFAVISGVANAQLAIGPEAGINLSNYTGQSQGVPIGSSVKLGGRIGAVADIHLVGHLYLQPGVFYVLNGYKETEYGADNITVSVNTVEMPINVLWKFGKPGHECFFVGLGPYFAVNISGTLKDDNEYSTTTSTKLNIGSSETDNIKAFDIGAGINLGYQMTNGLFIRGHYQMGFTDLSTSANLYSGDKMMNSNFGVTVGFLIACKKKTKNPAPEKQP